MGSASVDPRGCGPLMMQRIVNYNVQSAGQSKGAGRRLLLYFEWDVKLEKIENEARYSRLFQVGCDDPE
jgi:hypothetical protein